MDGFINIDKAAGLSSHDVVAQLKRLLRPVLHSFKIGHCGTLDPAATGVLPIAVGRATRLSQFVMGQEKRYIGEVTFGITTDSYDGQGQRTGESDASFVTAEKVEQLLPRFCGSIMQAPPAVSAIKRGGEPLYKKVRRGEEVRTEPRPVMIYEIKLLDFAENGPHPRVRLEVSCGQGAYIRSLAHDLGEALGCGAHLSALRRTKVGDFTAEDALTVEQIAALLEKNSRDFLIPMSRAVSHLPALTVPDGALRTAAHGNDVRLAADEIDGKELLERPLRACDGTGRLLGVARLHTNEQGYLLSMDKVLIDADAYDAKQPPLVACAIGNFDGLHLGHRALMEKLYEIKTRYGGSSAVVTFSPHPLTLIRGKAPVLLTGERLKDELLLEHFGVDEIVTLIFDEKLMNSTPEQFVDDVIVERLGVKEIVVGYNFTYAAKGAGTAETLKEQCAKRGVNVNIIPEVDSRLGTISSTNVRGRLQAGHLDEVNELLGYWFCMEGEVVHGNHIGRTIGFPTANFVPEEGQAVMINGVYAGRIEYRGATYDGVINFGVKPTIGGETRPLVEANLFDVDLDLYDDTIRVYFGKFLRPERKFSGLPELKAQIAADSQHAREFLAQCDAKKHLPKPIA
ncbi:MAG: bifunctional riboflavin kinase/FAD synthetase [Firmicutes bacterium]|nr:bifunctional riboflavin kinase/FAD synthetase [Bacillota bacterium]